MRSTSVRTNQFTIKVLIMCFALLSTSGVSAGKVVPGGVSKLPVLTAPSGKYQVGFKALSFERSQPGGGMRELNTWAFFPASRVDKNKQRAYLSDTLLVRAMKEEKYLRFSSDTLDSWQDITTHSYSDAVPVRQKFPLVLILHGRGSAKINYTSLAEEICSHGYVVIMSDHPGSGLTILKDGSKISLANPSDLKLEVDQMTKDACFLIAEVPNNTFLSGLADLDNIGIIGHSLGSMAMFNVALNNCGLTAAVNLDGYPFGEAASRGINIPHMTLWGELPPRLSVPVDTLRVRRDRTWSNFLKLSNPDYLLLKISGMYHTDFNDLIFLRSDRDRGRNPGAINPQRGYRITIGLTVAYLNHRLKGGTKQDVIRKTEETPEVKLVMLPAKAR